MSTLVEHNNAPPVLVSGQLDALKNLNDATRCALQVMYGTNETTLQQRIELLQRTLTAYQEVFGDEPVRIFRAPGRINLRGMHVDSHGGNLCLMPHQREVVIVAGAGEEGVCTFRNLSAQFDPVHFSIPDLKRHSSFSGKWRQYMDDPVVRSRVGERSGSWANYLEGAVLRVQHAFPDTPLCGMKAMVGSDLPPGAALSSSAALCVAVQEAVLGLNELSLSAADKIIASRDAEWYTGSRCGLSDQAAIILGRQGEILNLAVVADDFTLDSAYYIPFPEDLGVLVVNSYTKRSLSGAQQLEYTKNRFAYSAGLEILRQLLLQQGVEAVDRCDRFSRITPETLGEVHLYTALNKIPESITLEALRATFATDSIESAYQQYFGHLPEAIRPVDFSIRGPLIYGLAESARAGKFSTLLESGQYEVAGKLMAVGHDGDRVNWNRSERSSAEMGIAPEQAIEEISGVYGASSPALDRLVDTALSAGALGASLTGAGIAGSVLVLCRREQVHVLSAAIKQCLGSAAYQDMANRTEALTEQELEQAVVVNEPPAGAGELQW